MTSESYRCSTESSLQQVQMSTRGCRQDTKSVCYTCMWPWELKGKREMSPAPGHTHSIVLLHTPSSGLISTNWDFSALTFTIFSSNSLFSICSWEIWTLKETWQWLWGCYHQKWFQSQLLRTPLNIKLPFGATWKCVTPELSTCQHYPTLWKSVFSPQ